MSVQQKSFLGAGASGFIMATSFDTIVRSKDLVANLFSASSSKLTRGGLQALASYFSKRTVDIVLPQIQKMMPGAAVNIVALGRALSPIVVGVLFSILDALNGLYRYNGFSLKNSIQSFLLSAGSEFVASEGLDALYGGAGGVSIVNQTASRPALSVSVRR